MEEVNGLRLIGLIGFAVFEVKDESFRMDGNVASWVVVEGCSGELRAA